MSVPRQREGSTTHSTSKETSKEVECHGQSIGNKSVVKVGRTGPKSWSISGLNGLRPIGRTFRFTLDFNVFNDLIETTYRDICDTDTGYSNNVSMGMFSYYCGVALWYRLYAIKYAQGGDYTWNYPDMKFIRPGRPIIPRAIAKFFDMIGDFYEPNSRVYWKLIYSDFNSDGHFGEMSADTYYKYMAYPAPAILIATLEEELKGIKEEWRTYPRWKLHEISYRGCSEERVFTKNVCGYYVPLQQASPCDIGLSDPIGEQLSGSLKQVNPAESDTWWIFPGLLGYVTQCNKNMMRVYPMVKYENESRNGSPVQMGFVEYPSVEMESDDFPSVMVQGFSPAMIPDGLDNLIPVFRLRAKRTSSIDFYPYDFPTVDDIPSGWASKLNATFEYGDARNRGWNLAVYTTDVVDARLALTDYVRSF